MIIETMADQGFKLTNPGGNYTNNGYPTRVPTTTPPNKVALSTGLQAIGDGVVEMGGVNGGVSPNSLFLIPHGVDASTHTMSMKILGWSKTNMNVGFPLWIPIELCTVAITLATSGAVGVAGSDIPAAQTFGTTITMTGGPTFITSGAAPISIDWLEISPTSNAIGCVIVRNFGFQYMEAIFTTGGVVTSCNALYRKF